ncbi:MAG: type II toxin-antitoxin system RelE family toxin [Limisphaerales bacterium]
MKQATEVYSREFDQIFFSLPTDIRRHIVAKIRELGSRLEAFPHQRLQGRPEFRLRVGDYRVIYEFDAARNILYLVTLGNRRDVYR